VCTLVLGAPTLERLFVAGRPLVLDGQLLSADADELAREAARASAALQAPVT
jgi:hypothetical protein